MKKIIIIVLFTIFIFSVETVVANTISANKIAISSTNMTTVKEKLDTLANKAATQNQSSTCPNKAICQWKKSWSNVALGDYIQMTPNPGTLDSQDRYPTDTSKTGYSTVQYIRPKQLSLWRVIKKNSDGTVEMVSEYVSSTNITFKGAIGYANYVGYLNELADQYKNPTYTKATRHMGYYPSNPQTSTISDTTYFDDNGTEAGTEWTNSTTSTLKQKTTNESLGGGDTLYAYDTELVQNALGTLIAVKCNNNACSTQGAAANYWLASRRYYFVSPTNFSFYGHCVRTGGDVYSYSHRYYLGSWNDNSSSLAIRPIVTLKAGLTPADEAGTKEHPFVLP